MFTPRNSKARQLIGENEHGEEKQEAVKLQLSFPPPTHIHGTLSLLSVYCGVLIVISTPSAERQFVRLSALLKVMFKCLVKQSDINAIIKSFTPLSNTVYSINWLL